MPNAPGAGPALVAAACAICGGDDGVPVAVGANFADPADRASYLVLRCARCGLLYLNPRPDVVCPAEDRVLDARAPEARAWLGGGPGLPAGARVLAVGGADAAPAAPDAAGDGAYDVVLFPGTLELSRDPVAALARAGRRVRAGGRVVVVGANAGGAVARVLAGRHWAGYDFPRRCYFFTAATLGAAAAQAGLVVERVAVRADGRCAARSLEHLVADAGGPRGPTGGARSRRGVRRAALRLAGAVLDAVAAVAGRGARLEATLRPATGGGRDVASA